MEQILDYPLQLLYVNIVNQRLWIILLPIIKDKVIIKVKIKIMIITIIIVIYLWTDGTIVVDIKNPKIK